MEKVSETVEKKAFYLEKEKYVFTNLRYHFSVNCKYNIAAKIQQLVFFMVYCDVDCVHRANSFSYKAIY